MLLFLGPQHMLPCLQMSSESILVGCELSYLQAGFCTGYLSSFGDDCVLSWACYCLPFLSCPSVSSISSNKVCFHCPSSTKITFYKWRAQTWKARTNYSFLQRAIPHFSLYVWIPKKSSARDQILYRTEQGTSGMAWWTPTGTRNTWGQWHEPVGAHHKLLWVLNLWVIFMWQR